MEEIVRRRLMLKGTVVSDKMDKSVVVQVERLEKHPLYHKFVRRRTKLLAHDETNSCKMGDKVVIIESRPLSRRKQWRVKEVVERSEEEP
ncbi:30S ribosomal protein S17 [bacterium (candidate division B38) B3_B38]|nr:MAG: 30S ribosomal protein S17 [bacterium (candidate division B38) B3_B38]